MINNYESQTVFVIKNYYQLYIIGTGVISTRTFECNPTPKDLLFQ